MSAEHFDDAAQALVRRQMRGNGLELAKSDD